VQRIRYADNETNYCPQCQTGGRLLADRALSRLLRKDWPRSVEELEMLYGRSASQGEPDPEDGLSSR
jgi:formamidopyrimidine-DNA glycosylase